IDIKPCASRISNGQTNPVINVFYRAGGVNSADSGNYSLANGTTPGDLATTSFSGLTIMNNASPVEIGAVLTSDPSSKGVRLSRIAATVTYIEAPTNLTSAATTSTRVLLAWTDASSNESGFNVQRSTDALNWTPIATTSANVSSYYDTGLSTSTTYYHRVRAFNGNAYTAYTNVSTTTTPAIIVVTTGSNDNGLNASGSFTVNSNGGTACFIGFGGHAGVTVSSMTWGGNTMTQAARNQTFTDNFWHADMWFIKNPPSGNQTFAYTFTGGTDTHGDPANGVD